MISLLTPAALGLVALAALPFAIHLLTRRTAVRRAFPALRLLATSDAGRARRAHLRDALVLACRALALALAALAAAGALWRGAFALSRPAVVVVDASASMRQVVEGATAFARARAAATRLVGELDGRPVAALIAGAVPRSSSPAPLPVGGPALALLAEATPGWSDGDPAAAIAAAVALLPQGGDIHLVSDLATSALAGVDPARLPAGVRLVLHDAGPGPGTQPDNRGVTALGCEPGIAVAGRPLTVTARVANSGPAAATVALRLAAGAQVRVAELNVPAQGSATASVSFTPESSGWIAIEAALPGGDALADDDVRHGAIEVLPALTALVAGDEDRDAPDGALRPLAAGLAAAGFQVRVTDAAGLADAPTAAVIATAGMRDASAANALRMRLDAGACWLAVLGGPGDAALAAAVGTPPAPLGERVDVSTQERGSQRLREARFDHPLLTRLDGRQELLRSIAGFRYSLTPGGPAADATPLLAWADGTVALAERPIGAGRWLLLNCGTAAIDSTLARSEAFPLILSRLPAAMLPPQATALARPTGGEVAGLALTDAAGTAVPAPDGRARLERPGLYRAPGGALVAAAIPASESNLRPLDPALYRLTAHRLGAAPAIEPSPLWPWLLAAALVLFAVEMLIARGVRSHAP